MSSFTLTDEVCAFVSKSIQANFLFLIQYSIGRLSLYVSVFAAAAKGASFYVCFSQSLFLFLATTLIWKAERFLFARLIWLDLCMCCRSERHWWRLGLWAALPSWLWRRSPWFIQMFSETTWIGWAFSICVFVFCVWLCCWAVHVEAFIGKCACKTSQSLCLRPKPLSQMMFYERGSKGAYSSFRSSLSCGRKNFLFKGVHEHAVRKS